MAFLPVNRQDMLQRGWDQLDFLYISGDAYVDHPSFGHAIITRMLESQGYRVGIVAQPDWKQNADFLVMGYPKYGVLISSGVIDSMVNHYTASKKVRSEDSYSPGGKAGCRPDRAVIVYANKVKELFKGIPVVIGGLEASLRRFAHYDYWSDSVRRSILLDSRADILVYGMGERPITELARKLAEGIPVEEIRDIRGTVYSAAEDTLPKQGVSGVEGDPGIASVPSYEEVKSDKRKYASAFYVQYKEQDALTGDVIIQKHGDRYIVQNPPAYPIDTAELDRIYSLPYERTYHPSYEAEGGIPAIREVEFSVTSHRGCYGGCSFCALNFHQGRVIQNRSQASIINEAKKLTYLPGFKGYIHDVGGPTANFRQIACKKQQTKGVCKERQCLYPQPCKNLKVDHSEYLQLLKKLREIPEIKKVFIRSGIRYDYLMLDKNDDFFYELCEHHISGQLKVAPEHVADRVLEKMGKPSKKVYDSFVKKFYEINKKIGKEQYLVPYLISSHPGSDLKAAVELAEYLRDTHLSPEQVQDFYPTPGTLSTCMFYTGLDPRTMKSVYVAKSPKEKAMQRALLQYKRMENRRLVIEALKEAGREDLIGFGGKCLVRPDGYAGGRPDTGKAARDGAAKVRSKVRKEAGSDRQESGFRKRDAGAGKKALNTVEKAEKQGKKPVNRGNNIVKTNIRTASGTDVRTTRKGIAGKSRNKAPKRK